MRAAVIIGVVVAALVAGAVVMSRRASGPAVDVARVTRGEVVQTVVTSGRVMSPAEVNLGVTLSGVVRVVGAREGERVRAGQELIALDDAELAAQVAQARAGVLVASARVSQLRSVSARVAGESVRQAEANVRAARDTYARTEALHRAGAVAAADLDAARRSLDVAQSQLEAAQVSAAGARAGGGDAQVAVAGRVQAEAALRVAEAHLAQSRVLSPADGVILRRAVEPGDVVTPGRALLVLLRDGDTELTTTPDERALSSLRPGQRAVASAEAFPDARFDAVVSYLAPAVDAQRGTIEVRLRVPTPPSYLRPAMTVSVEVEVGRHADAARVPRDVVRDAATERPWVAVVEGGRAVRRDVALGLRGDRVVEVTRGLREGELVATSSAVAAGQRVRAGSVAAEVAR